MRQEEVWKNLLEELPVGAAILKGGSELTIEQVNHFFFDDLKYDRNEFTDKNSVITARIYSRDREIFEKMLEKTTREGKSATAAVRMVAADGSAHWHRQCIKHYGYQNEIPYYILISVNIDKAREMEEELRSMDERNRLLEEVTEELPFEYDVKKELFRVPQKYYMSGKVSDDTCKYMTFEEIVQDICESEKKKFIAFIREASAKEMSGAVDYRLNVAAKGCTPQYLWYRTVYRSILGEDGGIARIIGRSYDINSDREIQEKLEAEV